jgi:hypothetical protein
MGKGMIINGYKVKKILYFFEHSFIIEKKLLETKYA